MKLRGIVGLCLFFYLNLAQASNFSADVGDLLVVKVERLVRSNYYGVVRYKKPNINMKITVDNSNNPYDLKLSELSFQTTFTEKGVSKVYENTLVLDVGFYEYVSNPPYGFKEPSTVSLIVPSHSIQILGCDECHYFLDQLVGTLPVNKIDDITIEKIVLTFRGVSEYQGLPVANEVFTVTPNIYN